MTQHILIDGSGFIFRAYFACPPMANPEGVPVHAVYGFCRLIRDTLRQWPDHTPALIMFDTSRVSFRTDLYPSYKGHRPPPPPDLIPQFGLIREACQAMGLASAALEGFEADDLLATYTQAILQDDPGHEVVVVTIDKDMMQLVQPRVRMYNPVKRSYVDAKEVEEHWGVPPHQVVDVMALTGDASDGVPGVPGIGPKTAAGWIRDYGSLDGLLKHAHNIKASSKQKALVDHMDMAHLSRQLVTLACDAPLPIPLDALSPVQTDPYIWNAFCGAHGFDSLTLRIKASA